MQFEFILGYFLSSTYTPPPLFLVPPLSPGHKSFKVIYSAIWECLNSSCSAFCGADNWCQTPRKPTTPLRTPPPTTARATRPTASVDHDMQFYQPDDFLSTMQRLLVPTPSDTTKDAPAPAPSTHGVGMRPSCFCGPKPKSPTDRSILVTPPLIDPQDALRADRQKGFHLVSRRIPPQRTQQ